MAEPVSKEDVYIDHKGNFVDADDPAAAIQLAHKGVPIPRRVRELHGLDENGKAEGKRSKRFAALNLDLMDPQAQPPAPKMPKQTPDEPEAATTKPEAPAKKK